MKGLALIACDRSLTAYADRVLLARDVTPDYVAKVRYCCRRFCKWLGCDPGIDGLEPQLVNEFLLHLQQAGLQPDTVAGYRRALLVVWNEAYRVADNNNPPLGVRKIRTRRDPVEAFTHAEIRQLLNLVAKLRGYFPNGVKRADFWMATIHAAYCTGLRRGDLLRVKHSHFDEHGVARVRQNKTGYPVMVRLSPDAIAAIKQMRPENDDRLLPWPFHPNALGRQFRRLVKMAGVRPGQFRWLRRSAGSYAEQVVRGNGSRLLGHRGEDIFRSHYEDTSITGQIPVEPPRLSG